MGGLSYPLVGFLLAFVMMNPDYHPEPGNPVLLDVLLFVTYGYAFAMGIFVGLKAKAWKPLHAFFAGAVLLTLLHFFGPRSIFHITSPFWRNSHIFLPICSVLGALAVLPTRGKAAGRPQIATPGPQTVAVDRGYVDKAGGRLIRDVVLCYGCFITFISLVALIGPAPPPGVMRGVSLLSLGWLFFKFSIVFRIRFLGVAIGKSPLDSTLYQLGALLIPLGSVFFPLRLLRQAYRALDAGTVVAIPAQERSVSKRLAWLVPVLVVALFAVASIPGLVDARRRAAAKAHCDQGVALEGRGLLDEAMEEYKSAILILPNHTEAHMSLGKALAKKDSLDEAIAVYRHLTEQRPYLAAAHVSLGVALAEKGQMVEAAEELRAAARMDPNNADPHYNLGMTLRQVDRPEEAVPELERFIQVASPEDKRLEAAREVVQRLQGKTGKPPSAQPEPRASPSGRGMATLYLKDGRQLDGKVLERDADGILFETQEGKRFHFKEEEIAGLVS